MNANLLFATLKTQSFLLLLCVLYGCVVGPLAHASETDKQSTTDTSIPQIYQPMHQAAIDGSAEAQFKLGLIFEYGRGVNQDDSIAMKWYEKSAAQGFADAQYRLAVLYDNGWGKTPDKALAFKLYKYAADNGHNLAQHDVAIMYFEGVGVKKNVVHAYKWLKIAVLGGSDLMHKHLGMVAREMSTYEISIAEKMANDWIDRTSI